MANVVFLIVVSRAILSSRNKVDIAIQPEEKKRRAKVRQDDNKSYKCRHCFGWELK